MVKTWVLLIFMWSDARPVAVISNVPGYATFDECRLAAQQVVSLTPTLRIYAQCIYGPSRGGLF